MIKKQQLPPYILSGILAKDQKDLIMANIREYQKREKYFHSWFLVCQYIHLGHTNFIFMIYHKMPFNPEDTMEIKFCIFAIFEGKMQF